MGLDMYLSAEAYVPGYDHTADEDKAQFEQLVEMFGVADYLDPFTKFAEVQFTVGYWRKVNQIHHWFVENVQDGVDNCAPYYVSRQQLQELRSLCQRVLESSELAEGEVTTAYSFVGGKLVPQLEKGKVIEEPAIAQELLPTQDGFFFGSTDYDQWYMEGLKETITIIDRVLKMPNYWAFYYHSSW